MTTFKHQPLSSAIPQIRLLKFTPSRSPSSIPIYSEFTENWSSFLQPQSLKARTPSHKFSKLLGRKPPEKTITLTIRSFNLVQAPPYIALSYTWGPPTPVIPISIDGRVFEVRENLWEFLRIASRFRTEVWLWIDQICINQTDGNEKNEQVQMMAEIYIGAQMVVSWLGREGEDSRLVGLWKKHRPEKAKNQENDEWRRWNWGAKVEFFKRPYWRRVWVVQEVVLAKIVVFMCGEEAFNWEEIFEFARVSFTQKNDPEGDHEAINQSTGLNLGQKVEKLFLHLRLQGPKPGEPTYSWPSILGVILSQAVHKWRDDEWYLCEKPHDQVYGLMALVPPEKRFPVDYSKPLEKLFREILEFDKERLINSVTENPVKSIREFKISQVMLQVGVCRKKLKLPPMNEDEFRLLWKGWAPQALEGIDLRSCWGFKELANTGNNVLS